MSSSRSIAVLFAAALLAASACSDSTAPVPHSGTLAPSPAAPVTLFGTLSRTGRDPMHGLILTLEDGTQVPLTANAETSALADLDGAGVEVRGFWDSDQAFEADRFIVRRIRGEAVLDGVLLEDQTQDATDSPVIAYHLQLTDGSSAEIISPSSDMVQHLGARMWVRIDDSGNPADFGVIGQ